MIDPHRKLPSSFRFTLHIGLKAAALLTLASITGMARAGEVGAYPYVILWPDGESNFGTYTKAVTPAP